MKPHVAPEDQFEMDKYVSTILIVEQPKSNNHDNVLMGACFLVHRPERCDHTGACSERCSLLAGDIQSCTLNMTYYCPVEIHKVSASPLIGPDELNVCRFASLDKPSKLRIKYGQSQCFYAKLSIDMFADQIPGFKRLQRRSRYGYHAQILHKFVVTAFLVITGSYYELFFINTVMKWLSVPDALRAAWMAIAVCIWILLLPAALYTAGAIGRGLLFVDTANRLEAWHHVRSFEVRRRSTTDAV